MSDAKIILKKIDYDGQTDFTGANFGTLSESSRCCQLVKITQSKMTDKKSKRLSRIRNDII